MVLPESLKNPTIFINGIRIDEPVTMLTDILVSLVCFYAFFKLRRKKDTLGLSFYFRCFFLLMGIAAFSGGVVGHGFAYAINEYWKWSYWVLSMFAVAIGERAAIKYSAGLTKPIYNKIFRWMNIIELAIFMIISLCTLEFLFVLIHSAYGILLITGTFYGFVYFKTRQKGSRLYLVGIAWSLMGSIIFLTQTGFGKWFNHLDISHVLMSITGMYFYKASLLIIEDPDYKNT